MPAREKRWAVVPAAGRGERFGAATPKQYAQLHGRAVLSWSLSALLDDPRIEAVVVSLAADDRAFAKLPEASDPRVRTCVGGPSREESVCCGLEALAEDAREEDWVLVHDAARPCLSRADLESLVAATKGDRVGGLLAVPLSDTLKRADHHGRIAATVPREGLWRAQTPQMFRYGLLKRALALCVERGRPVTDEASAVEALGLRPILVQGRANNIKITAFEDLSVAEGILQGKG
jgi:2-C-methyl-D-erythritol 4-phosphate cytidylyltransferase